MSDSQYDVLIKETNTRSKLVFADDPTRNVGKEVAESAGGGGGGATFTQLSATLATLEEVTVEHPSILTDQLLVSVLKNITGLFDIQTPTNATDFTAAMLRSSDGAGGGYDVWHLFTNAAASGWYSGGSPSYVGYDFGAGHEKEITQYAVQGTGSWFVTSTWELEWSDNGTDWTSADVFNAADHPDNDVLYYEHGYAAPGAHRYWRIHCTFSNSLANTQIVFLRFYTDAPAATDGATVGGFTSANAEFGYRRVDETHTKIKNLTESTQDITVNIVTP